MPVKFVCPFCQATREWTPSLIKGIRTCGAHECRVRWANVRVRARLHRLLKLQPSGCLVWQGTKNDHGYGQITWMGQLTYVHRLMYESYIGPIPDGLELDHLCRVPSCANPAHLEAVPHKVNSLRGVSPRAMQARQTHCIHGHAFDAHNTYIRKEGARQCRQCKAEWMRRRYRKVTP